MTRGVLLVVGSVLLAGEAMADDTWREQSHRAVPAAGLQSVAVENARGRIEAMPSPDGSLHITALKIARATSTVEARELARGATVELEREGERYLVRVRYPRRESVRVNLWERFDFTMPRLEVRLTLQVPRGVEVRLQASSGDLYTRDLQAGQSLRASSGDVLVEGADGPVSVTTSSGDVTLAEIRAGDVETASGDVEIHGRPASMSIHSSSGDVTLDEVADSVRIETASGDVSVGRVIGGAVVNTSSGEVRLRSVSGRLQVATVSGEIQARLTRPIREASVTSSSGDIRLGLDPDVGCTLEMRTSSGSIDLDVPVRTQTLTRRLVTGVVRDGTAPVKLRSNSGSIAVVPGEP